MRIIKHILWACGCAILVSACTQEPAPVDYKGSEFFGRIHEGTLNSSNHETYPDDSPKYKEGYARPVEKAAVPTVAVSDLAPPGTYRNQQPTATTAQAAPVQPVPTPPVVSKVGGGNTGQFIWPINGGKVVSHFGLKPDGKSNDGINIAVAEGEPIFASADGMVVYSGNELQGYGNMVIIRHDHGWMTAYAHARSISVKKNDYVKQGAIIGYVGQTGGVKTPQLHFAIREGKTPVDPEQYLPHNVAGN